MPVFYFDVQAGSALAPDLEGAEFEDVTAVEDEARAAVLEIARHKLRRGLESVSVQVRNGNGQRILTVTVSVCVERA